MDVSSDNSERTDSKKEQDMTASALDDKKIIDMIISGQWEDVLLSLTGDMDPWDVDLVKLVNRFMDFIKRTNKEDLHIPAKIILAAAILYRMKVDSFNIIEEDEEKKEELVPEGIDIGENLSKQDEDVDLSDIKIPPISVPLLRKPQAKVTLDELINALDKAMTVKNRREARDVFQVNLGGEDISCHIEDLFEKICDRIGAENIIAFSGFIDTKERKDVLRKFNSLLHLSNQERVSIEQPKMFGEIYLTVSQQ